MIIKSVISSSVEIFRNSHHSLEYTSKNVYQIKVITETEK